MKSISYWARAHKLAARIIIIVSFLMLNIIGIITGFLLHQFGVVLTVGVLYCFFIFYFVAFISYPSKNDKQSIKNKADFYVWQKTCDIILIATTYGMIICLANNPVNLLHLYSSTNASITIEKVTQKDSLRNGYKSIKDFSASMKDKDGKQLKWKERKQLLKKQIKEIKNSNDLTKSEKVLITFLSILVALGLIYLIASLACNISCSGNEALAVLVLLLGIAAIVILFVWAMRSIYKKKTKVSTTDAPDKSN